MRLMNIPEIKMMMWRQHRLTQIYCQVNWLGQTQWYYDRFPLSKYNWWLAILLLQVSAGVCWIKSDFGTESEQDQKNIFWD